MLDCLKHMEEYDPAGAVFAEERIWQEFAEAAGVDKEELLLAYTRVHLDGYYGPISDEDWEEQDGRPMTLKKAIAIVHTALEHHPTVTYTHPDVGWLCEGAKKCDHPDHEEMEDDEPLWHEGEVTVLPESIRLSCFATIKEIYGRWL
jgi:hypothetical protein